MQLTLTIRFRPKVVIQKPQPVVRLNRLGRLDYVVPLKKHKADAARVEIKSIAKARQLAINADHRSLSSFWELYE